eukprot:2718421-Rhodomonas_salina.1
MGWTALKVLEVAALFFFAGLKCPFVVSGQAPRSWLDMLLSYPAGHLGTDRVCQALRKSGEGGWCGRQSERASHGAILPFAHHILGDGRD